MPTSHAGRWLTDAAGRVVVFHGINAAMKLPPYTLQSQGFTRADAAMLAREGFRLVRVWVFWKAIEPRPGVWDDSTLVAMRQFVSWLHDYGIGTMLNFAQVVWGEKFGGLGFPDWAADTDGLPALSMPTIDGQYADPAESRAWDNFWANKPYPGTTGLQDEFAQAWAHVAAFFSGVPGIVGYDPVNEPNAGTQNAGCLTASGCPQFDEQTLTPFYARVVSAIRTVDPVHTVFYEPMLWSAAGIATHVGAGSDPNLVLTFHWYPNISPLPSPYPPSTVFQNMEQDAAVHRDGLMLTEFGATDDLPTIQSVIDTADQARLGWLYWAWYSTEPTGSLPPSEADHPEEGIVYDPRQPPVESNLKAAKLKVLGEPYPYVIAGTPGNWGFDRANSTFHFDYATTRISGGANFAPGAITDVVMPVREYPAGYAVNAKGAAILSAPGAADLLLSPCPRASHVTITTSPSGRSSASCHAHLKITANPTTPRAGRPIKVTFRVLVVFGAYRAPASNATVTFAGHHARTDDNGRIVFRVVLHRRARPYHVTARSNGYWPAHITVPIRP